MTESLVPKRAVPTMEERSAPLFVTAVPRQLVVELDLVARRNARSRSAEVRQALLEYVERTAIG